MGGPPIPFFTAIFLNNGTSQHNGGPPSEFCNRQKHGTMYNYKMGTHKYHVQSNICKWKKKRIHKVKKMRFWDWSGIIAFLNPKIYMKCV